MEQRKPTLAVTFGLLPVVLFAELLSSDYGGLGILFFFIMNVVNKHESLPKAFKMGVSAGLSISQFILLIPMYISGESIRPIYLHLAHLPPCR